MSGLFGEEEEGGMLEDIVGEEVLVKLGRDLDVVGIVDEVDGEGKWIKIVGNETAMSGEYVILIPVHAIKYIKLLKPTSQDTPR